MLFQGYADILNMLLAYGFAVIAVILVFLIIFLIIWLKIWAWAIEKENGQVSGLGQVFVTLLIYAIISFVLDYALSLVLPNVPFIGFILGLIIEIVIVAKRHNMSYGEAFVAILLVFIVGILIAIVIVIILVIILLFAFQVSLGGLMP